MIISHLLYVICFKILECIPGYTGLNCSIKCHYPAYGSRCQGICTCIEDLCDASAGCKTTITGISLSPRITYFYAINLMRFKLKMLK